MVTDIAGAQSYVELLTCLQVAKDAKLRQRIEPQTSSQTSAMSDRAGIISRQRSNQTHQI
jgi:hypothetical protein